MTLSIQTRCPHCFSCFNLSAEQLDQAEAKGRCGQCQQIFLVNDNLVVSADKEQALTEHKVASYNSAGSENTSSDSMSGNPNLAYSLDTQKIIPQGSMDTEHSAVDDIEDDVWQSLLDQAMATDIENFDADQLSSKINKTLSSTFPEHTTSSPTKIEPVDIIRRSETHSNSTDTLNNSVDNQIFGNDTIASKNIINNSKFMKNDRQLPTQTNAAPHLTHLLTGKTPLSNNQPLKQQPIIKPQSRIQPASANLQTPIASILWLAGCLVLVLLLFAQYVIFNLNTLIKTPAYAAQLQTVCSIVVCSLPNADLYELSITELSYRSSQVNTNNNFSDIKANLVNNGTHAQLLPSLKVSVYDSDGLLGSFIAMPDSYLLSSQNQLAGKASESVMFTVPVAVQQIHQVTIDAIY